MNHLNNKIIFLSGGTGSFGQKFISKVLDLNFKKIIIFSRDELKQFELKKKFSNHKNIYKLRFFIGDIRDLNRLEDVFYNNTCDIIIHAAALKQVDTAEYNPFEFVKTNIIGTENLVKCALKFRIKKFLALSTDKAAAPINLYGATKLASDKIVVSANNISKGNTKFSVVRYGNVLGSRGSVIPLFLKNQKNIKITDKEMTRFSITLDEGINFTLKCLKQMWGGEIFIPKIPSYKITDIAKAINPKIKPKIIGIRPGEKLHEEMITKSDSLLTIEGKNDYIILPNSEFTSWTMNDYLKKNKGKYKRVKKNFSYNSEENKDFLTIVKIKKLIKNID